MNPINIQIGSPDMSIDMICRLATISYKLGQLLSKNRAKNVDVKVFHIHYQDYQEGYNHSYYTFVTFLDTISMEQFSCSNNYYDNKS